MIKHFLFCFLFGLAVLVVSAQNDSMPTSFSFAEQNPEYPGGDKAMLDFISSKLQYPQMEKDNHIQGRVVVQFFVSEDGKAADVKVIEKVSPGLDKEAIRVVKMLTFIPGQKQGKPVPVHMTLPVNFTLPKK